MNFFHLIDDLNAFMNYPWGTVTYDFLVKEMYDLTVMLEKKDGREINLKGFTVAIHSWAYEVFSELGKIYAKKLIWRSEHFSWILRWTISRCPQGGRGAAHKWTPIGMHI